MDNKFHKVFLPSSVSGSLRFVCKTVSFLLKTQDFIKVLSSIFCWGSKDFSNFRGQQLEKVGKYLLSFLQCTVRTVSLDKKVSEYCNCAMRKKKNTAVVR